MGNGGVGGRVSGHKELGEELGSRGLGGLEDGEVGRRTSRTGDSGDKEIGGRDSGDGECLGDRGRCLEGETREKGGTLGEPPGEGGRRVGGGVHGRRLGRRGSVGGLTRCGPSLTLESEKGWGRLLRL